MAHPMRKRACLEQMLSAIAADDFAAYRKAVQGFRNASRGEQLTRAEMAIVEEAGRRLNPRHRGRFGRITRAKFEKTLMDVRDEKPLTRR